MMSQYMRAAGDVVVRGGRTYTAPRPTIFIIMQTEYGRMTVVPIMILVKGENIAIKNINRIVRNMNNNTLFVGIVHLMYNAESGEACAIVEENNTNHACLRIISKNEDHDWVRTPPVLGTARIYNGCVAN